MNRAAADQPLQFLGSENPAPAPEGSLFHVVPAPFERSVSYGSGAAAGPEAILQASRQLEVFDGVDVPLSHGIYTWAPLETGGDTAAVFDRLRRACARCLKAGAVPAVLGGEHSVSYPAVQAALAAVRASQTALPRDTSALGVVQFDAHGDLRDRYHGNRFSHAAVMRRCHELGVPIHAVGVRALSPDDREMRHNHPATISFQDAIEVVPDGICQIVLPPRFPDAVYLTIDVDGLDPSVISATGTPEPGGLGWYQTLALIESLARVRRIVAFDVVELAPLTGRHADDFSAARLVYQIMGIIARARKGGGPS